MWEKIETRTHHKESLIYLCGVLGILLSCTGVCRDLFCNGDERGLHFIRIIMRVKTMLTIEVFRGLLSQCPGVLSRRRFNGGSCFVSLS